MTNRMMSAVLFVAILAVLIGATTPARSQDLPPSPAVHSLAWSPDGKTLASAGSFRQVRLWEAATGKELATLRGHTDVVYSVVWSPNGKTLASASQDKTVKLFSPGVGEKGEKGHSK
jgi:WD40 repeat protein